MNTIKLDKNFSNNCDELMKDLQKPTTQTEEIVWHKYPEETPDSIMGKLITVMFDRDITKTGVGIWTNDWGNQFSGKYIGSAEVIAWAELPKGWK